MTNTATAPDFTDPKIAHIVGHGDVAGVMEYAAACMKDGAYGDLEDLADALELWGADQSLRNIVARAWPTSVEWTKILG